MLARMYYNLPHPTWRSHTLQIRERASANNHSTPHTRRRSEHTSLPPAAAAATSAAGVRCGPVCMSRPRTGRADRNGTDRRLSGNGYTQRTSRKSEQAATGIGKRREEGKARKERGLKIAASVARPSARRPIPRSPRAGPASMGFHSAAAVVGTRPVSLVGRAEGACALESQWYASDQGNRSDDSPAGNSSSQLGAGKMTKSKKRDVENKKNRNRKGKNDRNTLPRPRVPCPVSRRPQVSSHEWTDHQPTPSRGLAARHPAPVPRPSRMREAEEHVYAF